MSRARGRRIGACACEGDLNMHDRIEMSDFADAISALLNSRDAGALTWPVRVFVHFAGDTLLWLVATEGETPDVVAATGSPANMFAPANGFALDAAGRRLDFVWTAKEIAEAVKQQAKN